MDGEPTALCLRRAPAAPAVGSAAQAADAAAGTTVCVVDDDPGVRDSLRMMLEAYGFAVATCRSGGEFLAGNRYRRIGCLIVDQQMPEMTGLDVCAVMQSEGLAVPTILITGRLVPAVFRRARALGVMAVLEKPFAPSRLVELVRAGLGRKK